MAAGSQFWGLGYPNAGEMMLTLITGGARSGKSRHALELAEGFDERVFVATAQAFDDEMRRRIADHRAERQDRYQTVEAPLDLAAALQDVPSTCQVVVVDCLTVWLGNLMFQAEQQGGAHLTEPRESPQVLDFLHFLDQPLPWHLVLVSNELGMGLVPVEAMGRAFRDLAGRLNQEVAQRARQVFFMVSGLPMTVKETPSAPRTASPRTASQGATSSKPASIRQVSPSPRERP